MFLNPDDIIIVGLLPQALSGRIVPVGNAAGLGAQNALLSKETRKAAREKTDKIIYIELIEYAGFTEIFIESLNYRVGMKKTVLFIV